MVKRIVFVFVLLLCLSSLVFGKLHYDKKLQDTAEAAMLQQKNDVAAEEISAEETTKKTKISFTQLPEEIRNFLIEKQDAKQQVKVLIIGSSLAEENEGTWVKRFKEEIEKKHASFFDISSVSFEDTSTDVIESNSFQQAVASKPDLVVMEPFLLNDNGKDQVEVTLNNMNKALELFKEDNSTVKTIILPSNPIYKPRYYKEQIIALKEYANEHNLFYADYWSTWPDTQSEEVKEFVDSRFVPTEKGHKFIADFVTALFY